MNSRKWKGSFVLCLSLSLCSPLLPAHTGSLLVPVHAESFSAAPLLHQENMKITGGEGGADVSGMLDSLKSLVEGTVNIRYRSSASQGLSALLSMSSTAPGQQNTYAVCYVNPSSNTVGVEVRDTAGGNFNQVSVSNAGIQDDRWHTITYCFGKTTFSISVDGEKLTEQEKSGFFAQLTSPDTLLIGQQKRTNSAGQWQFTGDIESLSVYDRVLDAGEIRVLHAATDFDPRIPDDPADAIRQDQKLFYNGYENSRAYRIPSLLTTYQGTVIAAIDQRHSGSADCGNIDTVIRRSSDGGETWDPIQSLIDLPGGSGGQYAMTIDASMVQDRETGRIFLLVDMFPESNAIMNTSLLAAHSGYKEVDGNRYLILRDYESTNGAESSIAWSHEYTVRENGIVYDEETGEPTEYTVENLTEGTLTKTVNGQTQPAGNIYVYTSGQAGELKAIRTSHLWLISSDDEGATWSDPVDLNASVKEDWMLFMGTGPGVGMQMENGRLVFPYYATNANVGASQSSGVIYSDDHGETWRRGETVCDALYDGGTENMTGGAMMTESQAVGVKKAQGEEILKLFCRNTGNANVRIFTSLDGGETWQPDYTLDTALREPYCQLSVVPYPYEVEGYEGRQMFLFANPDASNRSAGAVQLGYYDPETDGFVWIYKRSLTDSEYSYSCLSVLGEDRMGVLWEGDSLDINFTAFNQSWLSADKTPILREAPRALKAVQTAEHEIVVTFDQPLMVMGQPVLQVQTASGTASLPYEEGSGSSELVFDASAAGEIEGIAGLVLQANDSADNNEGTSFDPASLENLPVTGTGEAAITGLSVIPGYSTSLISFDSEPGVTYQIQRSGKKSYGYTTVGEVTADSEICTFQDPVGEGRQYYYRIAADSQQQLSASVMAERATGMKALQENAELYRDFSKVNFDGQTAIDLSEYAPVLQNLEEGSLIVQFKTDQSSLQALFNAAGAGASGAMTGNARMASVMTNGSGALRADLAHTRANTAGVQTGVWHTLMVSCANEGKTFRLILDGQEDHSWTASSLSGFLATVPDMERISVGGRLMGSSDEVLDGFTGTIQYVAVTSEVIDDESACRLTAQEPSLETLEIAMVQAGYASNRIVMQDGAEADIYRSETEDGEYAKAGRTSGGIFHDPAAKNTRYFYKAVSADGSVESEPVQADASVSRQAMKNSAQVYEDVSQTVFDGSTLVDISDQADAVKNLSSGTIVARYRTSQGAGPGMLLMGKQAGETVAVGSASNKAAVFITNDRGPGRPRFDFPHTRASIQQDTADDAWHTLVIVQDAAGSGSTFRMTLDGQEYGNFSGAANTGFFTRVSGMNALSIGGFLNGSSDEVSNGFQGEIGYVLITDEVLNTEAASQLSREENGVFSDISSVLFDASPDNTWVLAGGVNAQGGYAQTQGARNYAGHFEELIRWTQSGSVNGRQRYVINAGRSGLSLSDFDAEFDQRIAAYHPKAVAFLAGPEDLETENLEDVLASLCEKTLAQRGGTGYLVLETPVPAAEEALNAQLETIAETMRQFYASLSDETKVQVVLADHMAEKEAWAGRTDAESLLSASGHLEMARQLAKAVRGSSSLPVDENSLSLQAEPVAVQLAETPSLSLTGKTLHVQASDRDGWKAVLKTAGQTSEKNLTESGAFFRLPDTAGKWTLQVISPDGLQMLVPMHGEGDNPASISTWQDRNRELSEPQQELAHRMADQEEMTWMFAGDSITHGALHTFGYDALPQSFEKVLHDEMNRLEDTVINTGVSGATTAEMLQNLEYRMNQYDFDVCVLMFGTNDAALSVSKEQFKQNLKQLTAAVREKGAIPVLRIPNPLRSGDARARNLPALCEAVREVAEEENLILADHEASWNAALQQQSYLWNNGFWNNDAIHPSPAGQLAMTADLLQAAGLDSPASFVSQLHYALPLEESEKTEKPVLSRTGGQVQANLAGLQESLQETVGRYEVTASAEDETVMVQAAGSAHTAVLQLDPAKNWTVQVQAVLRDTPAVVHFAPAELGREESAAQKRLLQEAVEYARGLEKPETIHPAVWANFEQALQQAEAVLQDASASQSEVDAAWKNLVQAIHMLSFTADKSTLSALVSQAQDLDRSQYENDEAMAELESALEQALQVLNNENALDPSIEEACLRLHNAISGLHPKTGVLDTALLEWMYSQLKDTDLSQYANALADLDAFAEALQQAQTVLEHPESQEQIDQALQDLNQAWLRLRLKPSEELLRELRTSLEAVSVLNLENDFSAQAIQIKSWKARTLQALADPGLDTKTAEGLLSEFEELKPAVEALGQKQSRQEELQKPGSPEENRTPSGQSQQNAVSAKTENGFQNAEKPGTDTKTASVRTAAQTGRGWSLLMSLGGLGLLMLKRRKK